MKVDLGRSKSGRSEIETVYCIPLLKGCLSRDSLSEIRLFDHIS